MMRALCIGGALIALSVTAYARSATPGGMPPPPGMSLAASAAIRFPQPVRVGDLLHRDVLQPVESQRVLGTVRQVVRDSEGTIRVVIDFGCFLGFWTRPIAVPVDAMVLLGCRLHAATAAGIPELYSVWQFYVDGRCGHQSGTRQAVALAGSVATGRE
jgi:hypothetical protein